MRNSSNCHAVVYARYSSHGQTEQSIEGQLSAARTYAEAKGYTIIHEYIDRAMTGRNDNRAEFQKMLADTAKNQFSVIIVWKVDRFGRNREEITFNKYRCKKNGVRIEYVAENLPNSAEGVILESVLEGMAEYYSLQLSQNIRRGMTESAKKYQITGGRIPLGFLTDRDHKFVIDPETSPTVRMVFDLYANGHTISEIITMLNEKGLRTRSGKPFNKNSLNIMLKNEKYIGTYRYKDIVCEEDVIPAIVDKETFYKVQRMLGINRRAPSRRWSYTDYLLTDKLFCGKCGAAMMGSSGTGKRGVKYNYYVCGKQRRGKGCDKKPVRQEWIEDIVLREAQRIILDDETLEFIAENTWQYYLAQDVAHNRVQSMKNQLDAADKSIANLVKAMEMGAASEVLVNRMEELEAQKAALRAAIAEEEVKGDFQLTKDHILFFLEQFRQYDYTDRDCQRRLVEVFVNAIFLYDDGTIKIAFNFSGENNTVTLSEVDGAAGDVFARCLSCSTIPPVTMVLVPPGGRLATQGGNVINAGGRIIEP